MRVWAWDSARSRVRLLAGTACARASGAGWPAQDGTTLQGRAVMSGPHLRRYEHWPSSGRKPSADVLVMMAQVYETDMPRLLDLADHEHLAPPDRLTLIRP